MSSSNTNYKDKLNLARIDPKSINKDIYVQEVAPINLINHQRFDIMAKYIYGYFYKNNINSTWGSRLYEDHIWVFNNYDEDDNSGKKGINAFLSSYHNTLNSLEKHGFNEDISLLPINEDHVPIDGAHRLTAAIIHDHKVKTVTLSNSPINYNYEFFRKKGLRNKWSDAMAYEYFKLKENIHILLLEINGNEEEEKINDLIKKFSSIYYEKNIRLQLKGFNNLVSYIKRIDKEFDKTIYNYKKKYQKDYKIKFFLLEIKSTSLANAEINKLIEKENKLIYFNEKINSIALVQTLLNENSIHFLNYAAPEKYKSFQDNLLHLNQLMRCSSKIDNERICVVSDTILAGYGIKEAGILEYVCHESVQDNKQSNQFLNINDKLLNIRRPSSIDDIVFNPENFFYYMGIKFATLKTVNNLKKRHFLKNMKDILLIYGLLKKSGTPEYDSIAYLIRKELKITKLKVINIKIKLYKIFKPQNKRGISR